jgi:hypothetical protein
MRQHLLGTLAILLAVSARPTGARDSILGSSCDLAVAGGGDVQGFLAFDREFRSALMRQDAVAMAFLVRFPLRVDHPEGYSTSLEHPAALQALFAETFRGPVREVILKQKPESIFCKSSGIMYGSGEVWVQATKQGKDPRYQVVCVRTSVGGVGKSEFTPPRIAFICDADRHRIVIDQASYNTARYRAWNKPRALAEQPDLEISAGQIEGEGTGPCVHAYWKFRRDTTEYVVSDLGCTDGREPPGAIGNLEVYRDSKLLHRWWCY